MLNGSFIRTVASFLFTFLLCAGAHAQQFRSYIASYGLDSNPCTLAAPCRLIPQALNTVASGGEIWMLDSANFNVSTVVLTKSVTISAVPGAVGSVVAFDGEAIRIATSGVKVALRDLVVVPFAGTGLTGAINMTAGERLSIEDCLIANVPGPGINVSGIIIVRIDGTTVRNVGNSGIILQNGVRGTVTRTYASGNVNFGLFLASNGAFTTRVNVNDSIFDNNQPGVIVSAGSGGDVKTSISNSQLVGNTTGFQASVSGGVANASLSNNTVSNNGTGILAGNSGTKVLAAGNTVTDNSIGLAQSGTALFESSGDNSVRNNTSNNVVSFAPTVPSP